MIKFDLNLDYLKTFVAVALSGSMHRAAVECHLTQPAVSRQMALLSRGTGVRLFVKFGRGVTLTPAGTELLAMAQTLFSSLESAIGRLREIDGQSGQSLRLGASYYVAVNGLAVPVKRFVESRPEVRIDFSCGSSEEVIGKVRSGELDLAVATLPEKADGLVRVRLWTDTFVAAIPAAHPLANASGVTLAEIAGETLILPPASSTTRILIDRAFRKRRVRPSRTVEMETLGTIAAAVEMGLGLAILPARMFPGSRSGALPVLSRPIRDFSGSRELGILSRRGRVPGENEKALTGWLRDALEEGRKEGPGG